MELSIRKIKFYVKFAAGCIIRILTRIFYLIPIKNNRILFHAYDAKHICCNPKYIFEYMIKQYPEQYEYIWVLNTDREIKSYPGSERIRTVKPRSLAFYIAKASAKVCVINSASFPEIQLRKSQYQINTYHGGGCYKTAGFATKDSESKLYIKKLEWDQKNTSLSLSSSKYFSNEVIRKQMTYTGEIFEYGMPRNDILINVSEDGLNDKVKSYYGISKDAKIVLYAPTYRDENNKYEAINSKVLLTTLNKRFNGTWVLFYRSHYLSDEIKHDERFVDCSDYPDMQELLYVANILITDYSSSIWDYSFTGNPCFLFTPDLDVYVNSRGLDTPIETWGFPVCKNNTDLMEAIVSWKEDVHINKMIQHHKELESCETGQARKYVCERINNICKK